MILLPFYKRISISCRLGFHLKQVKFVSHAPLIEHRKLQNNQDIHEEDDQRPRLMEDNSDKYNNLMLFGSAMIHTNLAFTVGYLRIMHVICDLLGIGRNFRVV